ncbi:MAG: outer membrane lipoprotein-sorting protein [Thiohalomonadales bacterium]
MQKVDDTARAANDSTFSVMRLSTCKYRKKGKKIKCVNKPRNKTIESVQINTGANKRDSKSVAIILQPPGEKGIGMLTFSYDDGSKDTQSWLYLSALGKVKRMATGSDQDAEPTSLFGSEFTTEDMETGKLDEYDYQLLEESSVSGRLAWVIRITPNARRLKKTRYSKSTVWIDKERYIVLKSQVYDKSGKPYKQMTAHKLEKIKNIWVARMVIMMNLQTNRVTRLTLDEIALGVDIPNGFLTQRTLTDFAFRENELSKLRKFIQ